MNSTSSQDGFKPYAGIWPSPRHELLLRASLSHGDDALEAWDKLRPAFDLDKLDIQSLNLLPLLYKNLRAHNIEDPLLKKFKGFYRLTWAKNTLLFNYASNTLGALLDSEVQIILLKGAALTTLYYKDPGLRPMGDIDILVRPEQAQKAVDIILEHGWKPVTKIDFLLEHGDLNFAHGISFQSSMDYELDLHWHLFKNFDMDGTDDDFWTCAIPIFFQDFPVSTLNYSDQLLHVCAHGITHNRLVINWIADAKMMMSKKGKDLDKMRLISKAFSQNLVLPLKDCLSYLHHRQNSSIPIGLLEELEAYVPSDLEKREYIANSNTGGFLGGIPALWYRYQRNTQKSNRTVLKNQLPFIRYVQYRWGVENGFSLILVFLSKIIRNTWLMIIRKTA